MVNEFHGPFQSIQGLNWLANCNWKKTLVLYSLALCVAEIHTLKNLFIGSVEKEFKMPTKNVVMKT